MKKKILAADKRRRIRTKAIEQNKTFPKIESVCEKHLRGRVNKLILNHQENFL